MTDQTPEEESFTDRIQRAMNEGKKEELNEKYGMNLDLYHSKLSPMEEGNFLDYIEAFEEQAKYANRVPMCELIGNPPITPLADIADEDIEDMLEALLALLASHHITVDFLFEGTDEKEAYRFISEELLDEDMDDIRVPGMFSCFIYEDFYPNDKEDAKQFAEEFLYDLFTRDTETEIEGHKITKNMFFTSLSEDELRNSTGKAISRTKYDENIDKFHARYSIIMAFSLDATDSEINGDYATASINTTWEALDTNTAQIVNHTGISTFRLKRSPYGGWDVIQANIIGIECL